MYDWPMNNVLVYIVARVVELRLRDSIYDHIIVLRFPFFSLDYYYYCVYIGLHLYMAYSLWQQLDLYVFSVVVKQKIQQQH